MKELSLDNPDFLIRIFDSVDKGNKGYLTWDEFFIAMKLVNTQDLKDKIDLFFNIVDSDGNGSFSFDEIKDICKLSISKIDGSEESEAFAESTQEFFANLIFKILNKNKDDEIPAEEFKSAIFHGTEEARKLLSMFCCADA